MRSQMSALSPPVINCLANTFSATIFATANRNSCAPHWCWTEKGTTLGPRWTDYLQAGFEASEAGNSFAQDTNTQNFLCVASSFSGVWRVKTNSISASCCFWPWPCVAQAMYSGRKGIAVFACQIVLHRFTLSGASTMFCLRCPRIS